VEPVKKKGKKERKEKAVEKRRKSHPYPEKRWKVCRRAL